MKDLAEENLDLLYYLSDIFELEKEKLNECIFNALIASVIDPILISSFTDCKKGIISINLALYLISIIIKTFKSNLLVEYLLMKILSPKSLKREFQMISNLNDLSISEIKETLGIEKKGKSPLEYLDILKSSLENNNEEMLVENKTKEIIFYFMKVTTMIFILFNNLIVQR